MLKVEGNEVTVSYPEDSGVTMAGTVIYLPDAYNPNGGCIGLYGNGEAVKLLETKEFFGNGKRYRLVSVTLERLGGENEANQDS